MTTESKPADRWADGTLYQPYMGRWSRLVAAEFLSWLSLPGNGRWLDVGCGTGMLSEAILRAASPRVVAGIDLSSDFVLFARRSCADNRASFAVGSAESLPFRDGIFTGVVSGLALNFFPRPAQALLEMRRVASRGGTVAAYVWDYAGRMELIRHFWNAAAAFDPAAAELDEGRRFPLCQPDALAGLFESADLREVAVQSIEVETLFRDFHDYWSPFLGGQGPAPSYLMALAPKRRDQFRDLLRSRLPIADDGSIRLRARAWGVKGLK